VTDRQTDTQTDRHRMTAKAAHRAAKIKQNCITMTSLKSEEGLLQKIHRISSFFDHPVYMNEKSPRVGVLHMMIACTGLAGR